MATPIGSPRNISHLRRAEPFRKTTWHHLVGAGSLFVLLAASGCSGDDSPTGPGRLALVPLFAETPNITSSLTITVQAADLVPALVFNVSVMNGVAIDTLRIPAGSGRLITARAFDIAGIEAYRGSKTISLREGLNPPLSIVLDPLDATQPIQLVFGSTSVTLTPGSATLAEGGTLTFQATALDQSGAAVTSPVRWSTSNAALGTIDPAGLFRAVRAGTVVVAARVREKTVYATVTITGTGIATQVSTTAGWDGSRQIGMFGAAPAATVYGQSFTVPNGSITLRSITFWLNAHPSYSANIVFSAYVMAWDGTKATGAILWKSASFSGPTASMQRYDFSTGGVPLTSGGQYIAFLSTIEYLGLFPSDGFVLMGYGLNPYSGGRFYQINNATTLSRLTSAAWEMDGGGDFDAAFIANFDNVSP